MKGHTGELLFALQIGVLLAAIASWLVASAYRRRMLALMRGVPGATYCIGPRQERTNLQVVHAICRTLDRLLGTDAPLSRDGHPLTFLAQLNFAEFPALPGFPVQGIVQEFLGLSEQTKGAVGMGNGRDDGQEAQSRGQASRPRRRRHPRT